MYIYILYIYMLNSFIIFICCSIKYEKNIKALSDQQWNE